MAKEPIRTFTYPGPITELTAHIEWLRHPMTLPDKFKLMYFIPLPPKPGNELQRTWRLWVTGGERVAGIVAYQELGKTKVLFFDSYDPHNTWRTDIKPIGQPFADLVDHILVEHEKLAGPGQESST